MPAASGAHGSCKSTVEAAAEGASREILVVANGRVIEQQYAAGAGPLLEGNLPDEWLARDDGGLLDISPISRSSSSLSTRGRCNMTSAIPQQQVALERIQNILSADIIRERPDARIQGGLRVQLFSSEWAFGYGDETPSTRTFSSASNPDKWLVL